MTEKINAPRNHCHISQLFPANYWILPSCISGFITGLYLWIYACLSFIYHSLIYIIHIAGTRWHWRYLTKFRYLKEKKRRKRKKSLSLKSLQIFKMAAASVITWPQYTDHVTLLADHVTRGNRIFTPCCLSVVIAFSTIIPCFTLKRF